MSTFSEKELDQIFRKAREIKGLDPDEWRLDASDAIIRRSSYGYIEVLFKGKHIKEYQRNLFIMGLFKTAIGGMAWTTISTIVRSVVSLLQVSILTSYLPKSDFGIVAICNLFIGLSQIFLDLGISVGILHKQDITKDQYSSLFWLNIITGVVITSILCCLSPFVGKYYEDQSLTEFLALLSLTVLFSFIGSQHRTVQQKI